jgi:hypothetical protein
MWGDICLSLLFWSLANETTSMKDAAILYPLFGIGANMAQVLAGQFLKRIGGATGSFTGQFQALSAVLLVFGAAIVLIHELVSRTATFRPDNLDALKAAPKTQSDNVAPPARPQASIDAGAGPEIEERDDNASTASGTALRGAEDGVVKAKGTFEWAPSDVGSPRGQFIGRVTQGGGVVMQVVGNRCLRICMADDPRWVIPAVCSATNRGQPKTDVLPTGFSDKAGGSGRQPQKADVDKAGGKSRSKEVVSSSGKQNTSFSEAMRCGAAPAALVSHCLVCNAKFASNACMSKCMRCFLFLVIERSPMYCEA